MKENLTELKDLNFYFIDDLKQTLFDMLTIQKMLECDDLSYKERLLEHYRNELHANNPVEVEIVRNFSQMKKNGKES